MPPRAMRLVPCFYSNLKGKSTKPRTGAPDSLLTTVNLCALMNLFSRLPGANSSMYSGSSGGRYFVFFESWFCCSLNFFQSTSLRNAFCTRGWVE